MKRPAPPARRPMRLSAAAAPAGCVSSPCRSAGSGAPPPGCRSDPRRTPVPARCAGESDSGRSASRTRRAYSPAIACASGPCARVAGVECAGGAFGPQLAAAQPVDGPAARLHQQPGRHRPARRVVPAGLRPGLREDLLHYVLGVGLAAQNPHGQRVDGAGMPVVQLTQGLAVAPAPSARGLPFLRGLDRPRAPAPPPSSPAT